MGTVRLLNAAVYNLKSLILRLALHKNHHISVEASVEKCRTDSEKLLS